MKKIFSKILFFSNDFRQSYSLYSYIGNYIKRAYIITWNSTVDGSRGTRVFRSRLLEYPVNRTLAKVKASGDTLPRQ